jgi:hypothetical protein
VLYQDREREEKVNEARQRLKAKLMELMGYAE